MSKPDEKRLIEVIYLADHFYNESHSAMSPIYLTTGERYDWGFLQRDLSDGHDVHIRQATNDEYGYYERKLRKKKKDLAAVSTEVDNA